MALNRSKVHRRTIKEQAREIANVLKFMRQEADGKNFVIPVNKVNERTGISLSTVKRIKKEMTDVQSSSVPSFSTPKQNKNRPKPFTDLDDFDMCVVRRTINEFYIHEKRVPTVKAVLYKLRQTIGYKGKELRFI